MNKNIIITIIVYIYIYYLYLLFILYTFYFLYCCMFWGFNSHWITFLIHFQSIVCGCVCVFVYVCVLRFYVYIYICKLYIYICIYNLCGTVQYRTKMSQSAATRTAFLLLCCLRPDMQSDRVQIFFRWVLAKRCEQHRSRGDFE